MQPLRGRPLAGALLGGGFVAFAVVLDVLSVAPFVLFAAGVAAGADWAIWH